MSVIIHEQSHLPHMLNLLQLVRNGKRVLMMGDDTWVQLFPHHFKRSYPFPSFNVKDLHTVSAYILLHANPR